MVLVFVSVFRFISVVIMKICIIYDLELESLLLSQIEFYRNSSGESIRSVNSDNKESKRIIEEL